MADPVTVGGVIRGGLILVGGILGGQKGPRWSKGWPAVAARLTGRAPPSVPTAPAPPSVTDAPRFPQIGPALFPVIGSVIPFPRAKRTRKKKKTSNAGRVPPQPGQILERAREGAAAGGAFGAASAAWDATADAIAKGFPSEAAAREAEELAKQSAERLAKRQRQIAKEQAREADARLKAGQAVRDREAKALLELGEKTMADTRKQIAKQFADELANEHRMMKSAREFDARERARREAYARDIAANAAKAAKKRMQARVSLGVRAATILGGALLTSRLQKGAKGGSATVNIPPGDFPTVPVTPTTLSPGYLTGVQPMGLTSAALSTDPDVVCYRKSERKKRRKKRGVRRICYERKL